ncbi:transaldolase [Raphidocelis subcapitata]|uniref:Transaldolase n=1 Tax=Raphidocelis subcapitata TaxID=307507 RepID=A0A2V0NUV4_9CHLO|nr:transaldolase [Raphidocelis subcapitata]|eukprot:GBF89350.1 transaldolase [Raphidocelis subcapitata]
MALASRAPRAAPAPAPAARRAAPRARAPAPRATPPAAAAAAAAPPAVAPVPGSQLEQLTKMGTVLSIDTGDLATIEAWARTGLITDATTNPLFVSQAAARGGEPEYAALLDAAVAAARAGFAAPAGGAGAAAALPPPVAPHRAAAGRGASDASVDLAIDHLSVNLGKRILGMVPGYVSTEVDIRLSFDAAASEARARRIIALYEAAGVPRGRVLIKLAGTWEGVRAAEGLERDGIKTNITLVFGFCQAVAAAQANATLISPFPGRVLEWTKANGGAQTFAPEDDPGVVACRRMYAYFRRHGHDTICMPASWRSSTGADPLDEIRALAGTDRMTIPPPLLEALAADAAPLPRALEPAAAAAGCADAGGPLREGAFRWALASDGAANDKLAAGLRAFAGDTARLVDVLREHPGWR